MRKKEGSPFPHSMEENPNIEERNARLDVGGNQMDITPKNRLTNCRLLV